MNTEEQLKLIKENKGGVKTSPLIYPTWVVLSFDQKGKVKQLVVLGVRIQKH